VAAEAPAGIELRHLRYFGADSQAGAGGGGGDRVDDDLVAGQRPPTPVEGDVGEQPVLDLVPLGGAGPMPLLELLK
jgi:hypothetical protein